MRTAAEEGLWRALDSWEVDFCDLWDMPETKERTMDIVTNLLVTAWGRMDIHTDAYHAWDITTERFGTFCDQARATYARLA